MNPKTDHDLLTDIHAMVCGVNGDGGCWKREAKLAEEFYKFRRGVLIVTAFLAGGGGLSFGVVEIVKLVKG